MSQNPEENQNRSVTNVGGDNDGRTQRALQDLLALTTGLTDPSEPSQNAPMSEERQRWLKETLNSLCVDLTPELRKRIEILKEINTKPKQLVEASMNKYEEAMEELIDFLCDIDMAKCFYQLDGMNVIVPLLRSDYPSLRKHSAAIIVECCKNNIYCQQLSVTDEIFSSLMEMATSDPNKEAMFNAVAAVSAITRDNPAGISQFNKFNGTEMLKKALNSGNEKIVNKSIFLVMALCDTDANFKVKLTEAGVIVTLITLLRLSDYLVKEYILRAMLSVVKGNKLAQQMCGEHDIETYLNTLIKTNTEPEYQDLLECARALITELNHSKTSLGLTFCSN